MFAHSLRRTIPQAQRAHYVSEQRASGKCRWVATGWDGRGYWRTGGYWDVWRCPGSHVYYGAREKSQSEEWESEEEDEGGEDEEGED